MGLGRMDIDEALDRWVREGLLAPETALRLREDAGEVAARRRRRVVQGVVAATAAVVLVLAAGLFLRDVWEGLGAAVQSLLIAGAGLALFVGGVVWEGRAREEPASSGDPAGGVGGRVVAYGLQAAGLGALAVAYGYSDEAWPSGFLPGQVIGVLAFLTPAAALAAVAGRNRVMPTVVLVGAYAFFAVGLARFAADPSDAGVWILDGIFVVVTLGIANAIRVRVSSGSPAAPGTTGDEGNGADERLEQLLVAFAAHLYVGFPLLFVTWAGPLDGGADSFYLLDGWLVVVTAAAAWGVHGAPEVLRRAWMERLIPLSLIAGVLLAFPTVLAAAEGSTLGVAGVVAGVGLVGLSYGLRTGVRGVAEAACLALVVAAWTYTVSEGSPLAGAAALAGTAALLFWLARRIGGGGGGAVAPPTSPEGGP